MIAGKSKRYLERLIALTLISIVVLAFFVRVNKMSAIIEREAVTQTLSTIRLGMQFYMIKTMVDGMRIDLEKYAGANPFELLQQPPANYAGEFGPEELHNVAEGRWYYDKSAGHLVYRVSHYPLYEGDSRRELRYRLNVSSDDIFVLRLLEVEEET